MKIVEEFPNTAKILDPAFITLSDGTRLAAKIWMPENAEDRPVPAILEYLPYRYQDRTSERDALTHPYFAGNGYASVRVDMRGAGNSEGVLLGEYLKQEQDDAIEVIDWIREQPWCSGAVGMIGISWGGFNGLQVAARRPPGLKAIVTICSTDDRYADDIHYMGGAMLCDNIAWSTNMFSLNTSPPDPKLLGDSWREVWMRRLSESGLWLEEWLERQHRDEFYKHGSICENYADIDCAVYAVGGWADGYSNSVFRLMKNLGAPFKGLVGPWAHKYPHFAMPGPSIGFLQECLRWWDYWLKNIDTGIMNEPTLRCWMQESAPARTHYEFRPGKWVAENEYAESWGETVTYRFTASGLAFEAGLGSRMSICSPHSVGLASGAWCAHGVCPDLPGDQRIEAGGCLNFDTEPLRENLEILGAPIVDVDLSCDKPTGLVAACLNEVRSDGSVARVSYGILNLAHRASHEFPEPLNPGEFYVVRLRLNEIGHIFAKNSKIRLSLSTSYWPTVWPSQTTSTVTVDTAGSSLLLPSRPAKQPDDLLDEFEAPEAAAPLNKTVIRPPVTEWKVMMDMQSGEVETRLSFDDGIVVYDDYDGWTVASSHEELFAIQPDDANSARCEITWEDKYSRAGWEVSSRTRTVVSSTPDHFVLNAQLEAREGGIVAFSKNWSRMIPRKLV